jgi:hypothetical protein
MQAQTAKSAKLRAFRLAKELGIVSPQLSPPL